MYTREQLKNLTDHQMICIANVLQPHDEWQVSRKYADDQNLYEVLVDAGDGRYKAIVQILWGDDYDTVNGDMDLSFLIRHFDANFDETIPSEEELEKIIKIVENA